MIFSEISYERVEAAMRRQLLEELRQAWNLGADYINSLRPYEVGAPHLNWPLLGPGEYPIVTDEGLHVGTYRIPHALLKRLDERLREKQERNDG